MHGVLRNWGRLGLVVACLVAAVAGRAEAQKNRAYRIVIVRDGPSDPMNELEQHLKTEIKELFGGDAQVTFLTPPTKTNWTMEKADAALAEALSDKSVDLVIALGPIMGVSVGKIPVLKKPVLLPFAAPELQGLPREGDRSGRRNLAYITGLLNFEQELRKLRDIVPYDRIAVIVGEEVVQHLHDATAPLKEASRRVGVEATLITATNSAAAALAEIPADAQAVYFGALLKWSDSEIEALITGINARGLPSYAGDGVKWVEHGALSTTVTAEDDLRRIRRAALYAQRVFLKERPQTFDISFQPRPELVINMGTARAIGAWPRFAVMAEARLINDGGRSRGPMVTLESAIRDALRANLDLMASRVGVRAGKQNVNEARGQWLPGATASGSYNWIDPDGASEFGPAERQFSWGINGSQLLYSAGAHGNLRGQKALQRSVEYDYTQSRLDLVLSTGEAYLNVLRAKNTERVNRDNLKRARRNLSLAESRYALGAAGREEIHRWQIEIADSRSAVIAANAARNQAEIELNRILNRELEGPFQTPDQEHAEQQLPGRDPRLTRFVEDAWSFKTLREFMAEEAIRLSPEIRSIDQQVVAQNETLKAERRSLGIPDVSLEGGFQHIPHVAGTGSGPPPAAAGGFPGRDTFSWNIGLQASLTLFDGTQNYARIRRASLQLDQLQTQRAALVQRIEQSIRSSLHQAGSSYANIELTAAAADAANRNLDMVTDSYERGAVDIIRLIDAQNQALTNQLAAANARYDYLIDMLRVERASGAFSMEGSVEDREDFLRRLEAFAQQRKPTKPSAPSVSAEH